MNITNFNFTGNQQDILIKLTPVAGMEQTSNQENKLMKRAEDAFQNAMASIVRIAENTSSMVEQIPQDDRPDNLEIAFGLQLTAEATAVIVASSVDCQFTVTMSWNINSNKTD